MSDRLRRARVLRATLECLCCLEEEREKDREGDALISNAPVGSGAARRGPGQTHGREEENGQQKIHTCNGDIDWSVIKKINPSIFLHLFRLA